MNENYFLEQLPSPDEAAVESALGKRYSWYLGILEAAKGFEREWKHYGKKYGWKLKVHDGTKMLFELTVADSNFRIGMAVREAELQALRADPETAAGLADILDPGKSKEGWGIRLLIDDAARYEQALLLIKAVAALRR